ncbi:MAG: glycosyltransferase family 9 protein [Candidatus Peribacteraceae bacterium]|nr:glycosyltransferase family 9 protein [Candidatus Peribacteraceae bacterium]MDD5741927.1 glycosyltransferase family 9 protein [Candidatus Peribacteraceae bacterium]
MFRTFLLGTLTTLSLPWILFEVWMRSRRTPAQRRILIVQAAKIGDMVCMTPLFRSFREHGDHVTVLCLARTGEVLVGNPNVDAVIHIDDPRYRGLMGAFRLWRTFRSGRYDVTLVPFPASSLSMMGLWAASPVRIYTRGRVVSLMERWFTIFYSHHARYRRHTRTYDHYMSLARLVGVAPVPYRHELFLSDAEIQFASDWLRRHGIGSDQHFAAISLRAGNALKEWPIERFVAVARHIISRHGMSVVFLDTDARVTGQALSLLREDAHATEAHDLLLRHLAAVIKRASLFIAVDTGPLYMAHAFGVPLVDIIGPVDPSEQPPPAGPRVALVLPPPPCEPSSFVADTLRVPTEAQQAALERTTVAMVTEAVDRLLN